MAVTLTSPVLGQPVEYVYTGPLESWLLAQGYARQDGYTGPGVAGAGPATTDPDADPTLAVNREAPMWPADADTNATIANDATNLNKATFPAPGTDFDAGGVDDDVTATAENPDPTAPDFDPEA